MLYKILLIFSLLGINNYSFALKEITFGPKDVIAKQLEHQVYGDFLEVTEIADKLANKTLNPFELVKIVNDALEFFFYNSKYFKAAGCPKRWLERTLNEQPFIIDTLLADYPEALQELRKYQRYCIPSTEYRVM